MTGNMRRRYTTVKKMMSSSHIDMVENLQRQWVAAWPRCRGAVARGSTTTPSCPHYTGLSTITASDRSLTGTLPSIVLTEYVRQLIFNRLRRVKGYTYIARIAKPPKLLLIYKINWSTCSKLFLLWELSNSKEWYFILTRRSVPLQSQKS